jgi:hypothetical protein
VASSNSGYVGRPEARNLTQIQTDAVSRTFVRSEIKQL